ncbi:hypothetical protein DFQ26_007564, partial [Actinomortierella ambigua]
MSIQEERESRFKGVTFIVTVGMQLKLPQLTMATAALFFHRFYMRHSFKDFKYFAKESTRKFKDVIITCAQRAAKKDTPLDDQSKEYRAWKETIMYMEEILLEVLCFDLSVEHPYALMLTLIDNHYTKDAHRARKLKQVSWAFINDSMRTTLCLVYPPRVVALAAIHLSAKYLDENLSDGLGGDVWRELFEPDVTEITDAANEILEQYSQFGSRGSNNERG